jgi:hypothetical protein
MSAGAEMAIASGRLFGSALSALTALSHALALRLEMKTLDAPAWRKLQTAKCPQSAARKLEA